MTDTVSNANQSLSAALSAAQAVSGYASTLNAIVAKVEATLQAELGAAQVVDSQGVHNDVATQHDRKLSKILIVGFLFFCLEQTCSFLLYLLGDVAEITRRYSL